MTYDNAQKMAEIFQINISGEEKFWENYQASIDYNYPMIGKNILMTYYAFMRAAGFFEEYCYLNNLEDLSLLDRKSTLKLMGLPKK